MIYLCLGISQKTQSVTNSALVMFMSEMVAPENKAKIQRHASKHADPYAYLWATGFPQQLIEFQPINQLTN